MPAAAQRLVCDFNPRELSGIAWAVALLRCIDFPLLSALSSSAIPICTEFAMQNLANPAWAFAAMTLRNSPLLESISSAAIALSQEVDVRA